MVLIGPQKRLLGVFSLRWVDLHRPMVYDSPKTLLVFLRGALLKAIDFFFGLKLKRSENWFHLMCRDLERSN